MDQNILGIIIGFVFVFAMIFIATVIQKLFKLSNDFSRKIIHITVGNWIFAAIFYFTEWYYAIVGPVAFVLINLLSYNFKIFQAMELEEKNPGTIYYPISLTVCTIFTFSGKPFLALPFLGIMAMTWGDGMAAVIGKKFPIKQIRAGKSVGGSGAFFIFTMIFSVVYLLAVGSTYSYGTIIMISLVTAIVGVFIELFSPKNTDNLTVPLVIGVIGFLISV